MFTRCSSAMVFAVLIILFCTRPLLAMDSSEAAFNSLLYQVQFVRLIKPSKQIEQDYRALTLGPMKLKQARVERIKSELQQFWASLGIPTNAMNMKSSENLFQQVISLEPLSKDYLATSNKIRYLLWLDQKGDWSELASNSWLKLGDKHSLVPEISRRLKGLGDLREYNPVSILFDANVKNGVRLFQQRHGLKLDGIIGPETLRWINIKPVKRAELLAINFINKTRYLASIEPSFLIINIPAFELELIDNGQVALQSRVIVGKPYRQTPLLSSRISNLVINPSWRVPRRLLTRDLLPKVREDGGYIQDRNFNVFDRQGEMVSKTAQEWQDLAHGHFPYRLVQKPGEGNTLGRYKFYFENKYSVYLHDTADKELFEESNRALSSGCIRIENVEGLANWMASNLVTDKQTWVDMQTERQKTQWFSLDQSLPVHLVYWTAWVDKWGAAQFRNDIYHRNSTLNLASARASP